MLLHLVTRLSLSIVAFSYEAASRLSVAAFIIIIITKVFIKRKILSVENILSTHTHTRTHT